MTQMLAAALALMVGPAAADPAPAVFVEQRTKSERLTRLLVFDPNGNFASADAVVRRATDGALSFPRDKPYQIRCGTWRPRGGGGVDVRDTIAESFGPPAFGAGRWEQHFYLPDSASTAAFAPTMISVDVRYRRASVPLERDTLQGLRGQCASARKWALWKQPGRIAPASEMRRH